MQKEKVCLAISTFNRGHLLKNSLERLTHLTLPDEILVISDGCSDNTLAVVDSFKDRLPIRAIYNHNPEWSISSYAKNIALKNTECEIIIHSEPEILYVTDIVKQFLNYHKEYPENVISAGTIYHQGSSGVIDGQLIKNPSLWLSSNKHLINESKHNTNPNSSNGYVKVQGWVAPFTMLFKKEWAIKIGGVDEDFILWGHEDSDFLTRLRVSGINQKIMLDCEAIHQWHNKLPSHIQFQAVQHNEKLLINKMFNELNENSPFIIANQGKEWGVIIPKP